VIVQLPAGRKAGPCHGVLVAGWHVVLRLGNGIAEVDRGEANSGSDEDWARSLHQGLHSGQSG
jgi:hypothetical protein